MHLKTFCKIIPFLSLLKTHLLDLLMPMGCVGCEKAEVLFCTNCRNALVTTLPSCIGCGMLAPARNRVPWGRTCRSCRRISFLYSFLSPYRYENGMVRSLIHKFKYQRLRKLDDIIADLLFQYLVKYRISFSAESILIPIPLYRSRKRLRGFNQSELIARSLTKKMGIQLDTETLVRVKKTSPQIELSGEARRQNVKNVFALTEAKRIQGKIVLLLDDVKTTGATLEEAAKVLKKAGAERVSAITFVH